MRTKYVYASIGLIVVVVVGMFLRLQGPGKSEPAASGCPHDEGLRTFSQWRQAVTFPYTAPQSKLRKVKDGYGLVDIGSSKKEIIQAFGPPDFEKEMYPKEPRRPCIGFAFVYNFEIPGGDFDNGVNDKNIDVYFSPQGKVNWIVGNVGQLKREAQLTVPSRAVP